MSRHEEFDALKQRMARAESDRDAWRSAGMQEKYEEAYFLVEAIQSQIDAWLPAEPALTSRCRGCPVS